MKETPGAGQGLDQHRGMLSAGGRIEPKHTFFVRNVKDAPLCYSVSAG